MGAFCTKCGAPLNENGVCPRCNAFQTAGSLDGTPPRPAEAPRPAAPKAAPPVKRPKKRGRLGIIILVLALVLALAVGGVYLLLQHLIKGRSETPDTAESTDFPQAEAAAQDAEVPDDVTVDELTLPEFDAESYYAELGDVRSVIKAEDSDDVRTEKAVTADFKERGFTDSITTPYSMDGKFLDGAEISADSTQSHPVYETYYQSSEEVLWFISEVNGVIMAKPLTYLNKTPEKPIVLIEGDSVTAYDSSMNSFFEIVPSNYILKTVDHIDVETLDGLTLREVEKL